MDNTREFAAQALERAAEKMRDLRHGVADATGRYIADRPVQSALIAASLGALVMAVFLMSQRRSSHH